MTNSRPNNIPLPNINYYQKVAYTFLLVSGLALFIYSWAFILISIYWPGIADPGVDSLGVALGVLAAADRDSFLFVFGLHGVSMALILASALFLFKKTSLRRRVMALIRICAVVFTLIDLSAWYRAPTCSSTNLYVGFAGAISALPILALALIPLLQMWVYKRWHNSPAVPKRVVIVGGGFAGLYAALGLNSKFGYHQKLEITLLDKRNYFLFPPLLPSAAAGTIETRQVSYPFRRIFETTNIMFRKVEVTGIDPHSKVVRGVLEVNEDPEHGAPVLNEAQFNYDYLVLAPGSATQTFDTKGVKQYAFFMRELNDAVRLRNHVIDCFERAAVVQSDDERRELLTFVIVGAGPTGIETATEIHDLIRHVLLKRYPEIDSSLPQVHVAQSGKSILPGWPDDIVRMTQKQLMKMSVAIQLESRVSEVGPRHVMLGKDRRIATRTVVWAAGVKAPELLKRCGLSLHQSGRVEVGDDLRLKDFPEIFALGDAAYLIDQKSGQPLPPLGQVAFQQGSHAAKNLLRLLCGEKAVPFKYFDFGGLVSVGEHFAAVNLLGVRISGFAGWVIWRSLYLAKLVGVSNKIRVLIDWTLDLLIERSISQIKDDDSSALLMKAGGTVSVAGLAGREDHMALNVQM